MGEGGLLISKKGKQMTSAGIIILFAVGVIGGFLLGLVNGRVAERSEWLYEIDSDREKFIPGYPGGSCYLFSDQRGIYLLSLEQLEIDKAAFKGTKR